MEPLPTTPMRLKLGQIEAVLSLQPRVVMNSDVINDYWEALRDGLADLPPVVVFFDGKKYWLADGFHRLGAYGIAHRVDIPADVREGTKRDALRYSLSANDAHGLRRSNEDKRRAVRAALDDEEWGKWSDHEIARLCAVNQSTVSRIRESLMQSISEPSASPGPAPRTYTTKHGTTSTMRTGKIGKVKGKKKNAAPPPLHAYHEHEDAKALTDLIMNASPLVKECIKEMKKTDIFIQKSLVLDHLGRIQKMLEEAFVAAAAT